MERNKNKRYAEYNFNRRKNYSIAAKKRIKSQPNHSNSYKTQQQPTEISHRKERAEWTDKATAIATILLTVATIILAWFTYGLVKEALIARGYTEIQNRPFVQLGDIRIDSINENKPIAISFNIIDMGKFPAKIYDGYLSITYGNTSIEEIDKVQRLIPTPFNNIVSNETKLFYNIKDNSPLEKNRFEQIRNGTEFVYLGGKFKYESFITNKKFEYNFIYQLGYNANGFYVVAIRNTDSTLNKE
jgi:hypothetical protein